jgi:hypothetical protein
MTSTTAKLVFIICMPGSSQLVGTMHVVGRGQPLLNQLFLPIRPIQA